MFLKRLRKTPATSSAEQPGLPHACASLDAIWPFSPLITELLAIHAHTRHLNWLSQRETCREEFRLTARAILSQLLQAWGYQTGGRGTLDDLLIEEEPIATRGPPAHQSDEEHGDPR